MPGPIPNPQAPLTLAVPPPVANLAALRSRQALGAADQITLLGGTTTADGVEGQFIWDATSTANPVTGVIEQVTSPLIATGRWRRIEIPYINVVWCGAKADTGTTNNYAAFSEAITAANLLHLPVFVPDAAVAGGGEYWITTDAALPTFTTSTGYIGGQTGPMVKWTNRNGDCFVFLGAKNIRNLTSANMRTTALTTRSAVIRIQNSAYGVYDRLTAFVGADNNSGVMLEQMYDTSAEAAYLLVHIGTWYNTLRNIQITYLTIGANKGYGIDYYLNPNAISVVNPTGQPAGTYSGRVSNNLLEGLNVEGMERGINIEHGDNNVFMSGQFLGNLHQIFGRDANSNKFIGQHHNTWTDVTGSALNFDSTCHGNNWVYPTFQHVISQPWQIGIDGTIGNTLGVAPTWISGSDGITWNGPFFRGGLLSENDARPLISEPSATQLTHRADVHEFKTASGTGQAQIWLSQNGTLRLQQGGGTAGLFKVDDDAGGGGKLWVTSGQYFRPDGGGLAMALGNGSFTTFGNITSVDAAGHFVYEYKDGSTASTTNASATDVASYTLLDNSTAAIEFVVTARCTGGSAGTVNDVASWIFRTTAAKKGATTTSATIIGTDTTHHFDTSLSGVTADVATGASGLVKISVSGLVNVNLSWHTSLRVNGLSFVF